VLKNIPKPRWIVRERLTVSVVLLTNKGEPKRTPGCILFERCGCGREQLIRSSNSILGLKQDVCEDYKVIRQVAKHDSHKGLSRAVNRRLDLVRETHTSGTRPGSSYESNEIEKQFIASGVSEGLNQYAITLSDIFAKAQINMCSYLNSSLNGAA